MSAIDNFNVLDFEASSLQPNSYPIEMGWTIGLEVHSYLIRPYAVWTDWSDFAEKSIHKITREQLWDEGLDPAEVMKIANDVIGDRIMCVDGGLYDRHWLNVLAVATEIEPTFKIADIGSLFHGLNLPYELFLEQKRLLSDSALLHRAGYDAMMIKTATINAIQLSKT